MARQRDHRSASYVALLLLSSVMYCCHAAYVQFANCLAPGIIRSDPRLLQIVPLNVTAFLDASGSSHNLTVTFYGNVTGQRTEGVYPPPDDPSWTDPESTFGKIEDLSQGANLYTTLFSSFNVLSYTPYNAPAARFCNETIHQECPLAPSFDVDQWDLSRLLGWTVAHDLGAAYAFTEIVVTSRVQSGAEPGNYYACVHAYMTPDIGTSLRDLLRYLPLGILILVGVATISAAMFSPWGTWDVFRWTSNFGRDEDVLRLVTPGFTDCLQYLQFVVLTGSLSLNYPGFYQPVVSRVGWSSLLFNESFVSGGDGYNPIVDGLYQYRNASTFGMDRMTQLIGMSSASDAWAAMMVWLVVIVAAVVFLTQVGFFLRWIYRMVTKVPPEDLRSKNWYFSVGNVIRITVGFFILPILSISMFQFAITRTSPVYTTVLAAVVVVGIIIFSVRLVYMFARIRPRSFLFDDLQCVLAYGPLYNTYRDDAATFAFIPILVNFLRAIAIGAVQASGVAQIVLLAISEIMFVLAVNAFRPYPPATSMNLYHSLFSILRLVAVLLLVAFVPSLNVSGGSRGWIGYTVLLIHACVFVFGFLLNAVQTLVEVIARLAGAGGSSGHDAARGGLAKVFGVRQLSKRTARGDTASRHSMSSNAAMLHAMDEHKDRAMIQPRSRSISASSTMLLEGNVRSPARDSQQYAGTSDGQITPDARSTFSMGHRPQRSTGSGIVNLPHQQGEAKDPYYRPPRRNTMDLLRLDHRSTSTGTGGKRMSVVRPSRDDRGEGSSTPLKMEDFEDPANELTKTKTDYAVREVDFYYGVRGPALSSGTRKLKTGPADPTGPVSNATGWFKGLLGGRKKEKTKGFEVVRSARAPPPGAMPSSDFDIDPEPREPYRDLPIRGGMGSGKQRQSLLSSSERGRMLDGADDRPGSAGRTTANPPTLPLIDSVGDIELPSRVGSEYSKRQTSKKRAADPDIPEIPELPRRSSRRGSSVDSTKVATQRLSVASNPSSSGKIATRLPFAPPQSAEDAILGDDPAFEDLPEPEQETPRVVGAPSHRPQVESTPVESSSHAQSGSIRVVREHRTSDSIVHQGGSVPLVPGRTAVIRGRAWDEED